MIYDLRGCPYSDRHGFYGGQAGDKDGILINGEYWIVKYPKSTRDMSGNNLPSYTTSPLSEYLGSHIYQILEYDVHQTVLGWRNDKLVVACKDFCKTRGSLMEIRTIKNAANKELSRLTNEELPHSTTGDRVDLDELLLHFRLNPLLKNIEGVEDRFWETAIVDIFINNNDRNNGNWGLLWDEETKTSTLAPIYDNGNSFHNKWTFDRIETLLANESDARNEAIGGRTAYERNGHILSAKRFLELNDDKLRLALLRVVPNIYNHQQEIKDFIRSLEVECNGQEVCSEARKEVYIKDLDYRLEELLIPRYCSLAQEQDIEPEQKEMTDEDMER